MKMMLRPAPAKDVKAETMTPSSENEPGGGREDELEPDPGDTVQ